MSVTYYGLACLQPLLRKCGLDYYDRITGVHLAGGRYSDDVIPQLTRFPHLRQLSLSRTKITPAGLAALREQLHGCEVAVY